MQNREETALHPLHNREDLPVGLQDLRAHARERPHAPVARGQGGPEG